MSHDQPESPYAAHPLNHAFRNDRSYAETRAIRSAPQTIEARIALFEASQKGKASPEEPVLISYDLLDAGKNLNLASLWTILMKFKDLVGLFTATTSFLRWYNGAREQWSTRAVIHPREFAFRCYSDLIDRSRARGLIFAFENQSSWGFLRVDHIDWYGWPELCMLPGKIEANTTSMWDHVFWGLWNTAAQGNKYKIFKDGRWVGKYLYIAAYTYTFGGNYVRTIVTSDDLKWDDVYESLKSTSDQAWTDEIYVTASINSDFRARVNVQVIDFLYKDIATTPIYFSSNWTSMKDYGDFT